MVLWNGNCVGEWEIKMLICKTITEFVYRFSDGFVFVRECFNINSSG